MRRQNDIAEVNNFECNATKSKSKLVQKGLRKVINFFKKMSGKRFKFLSELEKIRGVITFTSKVC